MKAMKHSLTLLALLIAMIVFALPVLAGDRDEHQITIIDEDGVTYICKYSEDMMRVFNKETGEEIAELDFKEIERAIEDAMDGVEEALESAFDSLEDMELDLHFGDNDNRFKLDLGDEDITIDFDELFESIGEVLEDLDFDIDFDDHHHGREHRFHVQTDHDSDDLMDEIDELKAEIRKLKKELRQKEDNEF